MRKRNILFLLLLILAFVLSACSSGNFPVSPSKQEAVEPPVGNILVGGDLRGSGAGRLFQGHQLLPQDAEIANIDIEHSAYLGESMLVFAGAMHKEAPYAKVVEPYYFCVYDADSGSFHIAAQIALYTLVSVDGTSDGQITALAISRQDGPYSIIEISPEGNISEFELTGFPQADTERFSGAWKTEDGYMLGSSSGLIIIDPANQTSRSVFESNGSTVYLLRGKDDSLLFPTGSTAGTTIRQVDSQGNVELIYEDSIRYIYVHPLTRDSVLACDGNMLWKIHPESGEKEIFASAGNGLLVSDILYISENRLYVNSLSKAYLFEPVMNNITTLKVAGWVPDETAESPFFIQNRYEQSIWWGSITNHFSKYAEDVYIDYISYSGKDGLAALRADMEAGYVPDMLDTTYSPPGIFNDYLLDMYPSFEANTGLCTDQLFASVLSTLEDDGALYEIAPAFKISTMYGRSSNFHYGIAALPLTAPPEELRRDWTASDFIAMADQGYPGQMLGSTTREEFLTYAFMFLWDDYVDYASASCRFNSESFLSFLRFVSQMPGDEDAEAYDVWGELFEGIRLFSIMPPVANPLGYIQSAETVMFGDVQFMGFPDEQGSSFGMYPILKLGICRQADSEEQRICWDLVKFILSDDACVSSFMLNSICIDRDIFTQGFKDAVSLQNSSQSSTRLIVRDQSLTFENDSIGSDEEDIVWELLNGINQECYFDPELYLIICRYAELCASGAISPEAAAEAIQNEATVYLASIFS